jgi:hypothetical protein
MSKNIQPKVSEIIHSVLGDRIDQSDSPSKFCKDIRIYKNLCIEKYQLLGFKLIGLDNQIHKEDYDYYHNYSFDIKCLQKKISDAFRNAGYDIKRVILQPAAENKNWSLSFTIVKAKDDSMASNHKVQHAVCVKKIAVN